jgi:hypothetical protein
VKAGGALVVIDDDADPFNKVREWWNTGDMHFATPRHHLFDKLGLPHDATAQHKVGQGLVIFEKRSPSALSRAAGGADMVRSSIKHAMAETAQTWKESSALVLRRGPYIVAAGLADPADTTPVALKGRFIPLFDAVQPVVNQFAISPGVRALLVDLDRYPKDHLGVVAAACCVTNQKVTDNSIAFDAIGQAETSAVVSILLPRPPHSVTIEGEMLKADAFDYTDGVLRIRFPNRAQTMRVSIAR